MKILWISHTLPFPPKTGVMQRNFNLLNEASKFADIDLIAVLKHHVLPDFDLDLARRELSKICRNVDVVELPIENSKPRLLAVAGMSVFSRHPFSVNWATATVLAHAIRHRAQQDHHDVAYFDTISYAQYRPLVDGIPAVLNHHNVESQLLARRIAHEGNRLKRYYYRMEAAKLKRYEREVCGEFDVNFTVSELDSSRLSAIAENARTRVIANGVDTNYFSKTTVPQDPNRLIIVSGMNWFPNRDAVLFMLRKIWPLIIDRFPQAKLQIVGASPPAEIVKASEEDDRIEVTGFVDDVRPYMSAASIYLCPMRDGGGTRLKILDALSMSMPIVATTMAVEGIQVEPEREVLIGDTAEAFAAQVLRALQDPQLRSAVGRHGRAFVEREFSWSIIGRSLRDEFHRLAYPGSIERSP